MGSTKLTDLLVWDFKFAIYAIPQSINQSIITHLYSAINVASELEVHVGLD